MKTRLLIIGTIVFLVIGFAYLLYFQYTHYETLGNNEHWYYHPDGYDVECEMQLFQSPGSCKAIDENGIIVDAKTKLENWNGVKWLQDPDYCKDQGGIWNSTAKGCYGLYDMCEKDGGVPRFLKKSLPFPDIEENKPIKYLMDCYYGLLPIDDDYLVGFTLIDASQFNNNPEMVKRILDYCNSTGVKLSVGLRSSNGTHTIDNNTCEWQTIEKYESDRELNSVLSICEHSVRPIEDNPAFWSNTTHYIDTNNCEWIENENYPFGLTGPEMSQQNCNDYVISQWQPRVEDREMVQQFLEICIQRGFLTPDLVERGKVADNFTMGPIQSAQTLAEGDIEKTIEILEEMYGENEN